ncbi:hypothetical protein VUR80DRAFT_4194 [Thermomyces stellatus]
MLESRAMHGVWCSTRELRTSSIPCGVWRRSAGSEGCLHVTTVFLAPRITPQRMRARITQKGGADTERAGRHDTPHTESRTTRAFPDLKGGDTQHVGEANLFKRDSAVATYLLNGFGRVLEGDKTNGVDIRQPIATSHRLRYCSYHGFRHYSYSGDKTFFPSPQRTPPLPSRIMPVGRE